MRMAKMVSMLILLLATFIQADTNFDYVWKSPEAEPVSFAGKKVAVILVSKNRAARMAAEEALAKEITKRGAQGIAAHTLVTETELKEREPAKARFKEEGVAGAVVIRGTPKGEKEIDPDMWKNPIYKDIWGFTSSSWNQVDENDDANVKFHVEVAVYSLDQDRVIWIGNTQLKAQKLPEFVQSYVDEIAEEMLKAGLLIPRN
jgi:hypothetical protein